MTYLEIDSKLKVQLISQTVTSAATSLNQVPAIFKSPIFKAEIQSGKYSAIFDFGAGKYDKTGDYCAENFPEWYLPYDPYNRPMFENAASMDFARALINDLNLSMIVVCSNVLNVIDTDAAIYDILFKCAFLASNDGAALFKIYEGDKSGIGGRTVKGYQRNARTADYMDCIKQYFGNVKRYPGNIIKAW